MHFIRNNLFQQYNLITTTIIHDMIQQNKEKEIISLITLYFYNMCILFNDDDDYDYPLND